MTIGAVASLKKGLEHFIYRDLTVFSAEHAVQVFATKFGSGLYDPRPEWSVHRWNPWMIAASHLRAVFTRVATYASTLRIALRYHALADWAIAWAYADGFQEVDVIYATFGDHKLFVGYFAKLIVQKPLVVMIHAYELYNNPNKPMFLEALGACDRVLTVTEYNRRLIAAETGLDAASIEVIRISVDLDDFTPRDPFRILIVAFFAERKGHEVLLRAVRSLGLPDIEVWVVGDDGSEDNTVDVRALAAELGLDDQVAFFGRLGGPALKALYRSCDVFCLPCHTDSLGVNEGFPTVIAEAMAFGKPVVSTRHVEIPFILEEGLVDERDVQGLAAELERLYRAPDARTALAAKNRSLAEKLFSTANARRTMGVLESVSASPVETEPGTIR